MCPRGVYCIHLSKEYVINNCQKTLSSVSVFQKLHVGKIGKDVSGNKTSSSATFSRWGMPPSVTGFDQASTGGKGIHTRGGLGCCLFIAPELEVDTNLLVIVKTMNQRGFLSVDRMKLHLSSGIKTKF